MRDSKKANIDESRNAGSAEYRMCVERGVAGRARASSARIRDGRE
jgi:hypothetical protein